MERRSTGWSRQVEIGFGALLVLAYTGASLKLAAAHSHFIADDLVGFWLAAYKPFATYIALPLDIHMAPLHRLTTFVIHALWPMNFRAGLAVLALFHLAGVALLYMTLERIQRTAYNWVFVGLYATHIYLPPLFFWWTAGLHRLPCIAFSFGAVYAFVRFRESARRRWIVLLVASELCAFGFFIKAALVPLVLAGIEACLWKETDARARRRNGVAISISVLSAFLYVAVWFVRAVPAARAIAPNAAYLAKGMAWNWRVLLESTLGLRPGGAAPLLAAGAAWLGAVAVSVRKGRSSAVGYLSLVGVVSASIFMTLAPLSRYVLLLGSAFETVHRYYFELMGPVALFSALAFRKALSTFPPEKRAEAVAAAVLVLAAIHSFAGARSLLSEYPYTNYGKQKELIENLTHDLRALRSRGEEVVIVDADLPPFTLGWLGEWRRQSRLLEAMGIPQNFGKSGNYRITEDGHVIRIEH